MQFSVKGAHRATGRDAAFTIEAPTPSAAEQQANAMNIMVERIDAVLPDAEAGSAQERKWNPGVAAVLSLVIPGAGQLYKGQVFGGLAWLFLVGCGYVLLVVPGVILHLCCIVGASMGDPTQSSSARARAARPREATLLVVLVVLAVLLVLHWQGYWTPIEWLRHRWHFRAFY